MIAHNHYFKPCPFDHVDVYRVLSLFGVVDPCLQHATKKLLVAGGRGHKDISRDVQDVIDSLERWKAMRAEEAAAAVPDTPEQRSERVQSFVGDYIERERAKIVAGGAANP
jgi:hypothetical protein